jgi:two-component system, NtrC family, response regulator HydG
MSQFQVLIVHPDPSAQSLLASMLRSLGHGLEDAANDRIAVRRVDKGGIHLVISGVDPDDPDALELLAYLRRKHSKIPVILLFSNSGCDKAREASRLGATVLRYPAPATEFRAAVTQGLESWQDASPSSSASPYSTGMSEHRPAQEPKHNGSFAHPTPAIPAPRKEPQPNGFTIVGEAPGLKQAVDLATTAAPTRTPVVIVGEQGTGKSMIARAIHQASPRADRPFVEVVCGGLDEAQLERELFGQSFGRADAAGMLDRPGKVFRAAGGTLFLDEVVSLTPSLQRQLLRLLQDGEFEPAGAIEPIRVDIRLILASNENLSTLVEQGRFRRDLYDRVGVVCLRLPPLRERGGDIEALAEHFRARFATEFSKPVVGFTPDALDLLCRHDWPGNVRELESVIQRGVALCQGARVTSANLSLGFGPPRAGRNPSYSPRPHLPIGIRPLKEALEEPEKQIIIQALQALNWNRQETARVLDINRTTLYKKMKKYGLLLDEPAMMN